MRNLRSALPIVAAALGRKFGVTVAVGGSRACTDGRVIQLPDLPEDPAARDLAWGYLAHEAAHVRYTDFGAYRRAAQAGPLQAAIQNILEDVRIERALAGPYPGTRATIASVLRRLLADGELAAPAGNAHPAVLLQGYLLLKLRHQVLRQEPVAAEAERAERRLARVFPARVVRQLNGLMAEVPELGSTAQAVDLARRIVAMLEAERATAPSPPDTPSPPPTGSGLLPSQADNGPRSESAGDDGEEAAGAPVSAEDSPSSAAADSLPGSDADPGTSAVAGNNNVSDRSGKSGYGHRSEPNPAADPSAQDSALSAALGAGPADVVTDLFEAVGERLARQSGPASLRLPVAQDVRPDATAGRRLLERVQAESARLRARLHGLVQASRMDRPRNVRTGRRLAHRHLHRAVLADDRVFRRNQRRVAPNTAVHLVVDVSGSMGAAVTRADGGPARRIELALEAALALALALESIPGTSVGVTAFPGQRGRPDRVERLLGHGVPVRSRAGAFALAPRGGTPMAEALGYAATELLLRPEARRLLLVLTDGVPDSVAAVLELLQRCRRSEVEVVGIGIQTDVGGLFPVAVEVAEVGDLKRMLFRVAERVLVAA